jgi:hypothetical protein
MSSCQFAYRKLRKGCFCLIAIKKKNELKGDHDDILRGEERGKDCRHVHRIILLFNLMLPHNTLELNFHWPMNFFMILLIAFEEKYEKLSACSSFFSAFSTRVFFASLMAQWNKKH